MNIEIPKDHPRYHSLMNREKVVDGMETKVVAPAGLIAHGRGEAFDYLMGEVSGLFALKAVKAAACAFLTADHPVISVNGNVAALCPEEFVELARLAGAALEINLFYRTPGREEAILEVLKRAGAGKVFGVGESASARIPEVGSERRRVDPEGILKADLVFVPLEDGDRTEGLVKMGKTVVTVDLNPLSRTARRSSITIVDNIIRTMPLLIREVKILRDKPKKELHDYLKHYNNTEVLADSLDRIIGRLEELKEAGIE